MVDQIIRQMAVPPALDATCETDMAEGLRAMALERHGLAFLPASRCNRNFLLAAW